MNNFCECSSDGYCDRYKREIAGRSRQICAGVNVDLGTAAAFREQWSREAGFYQYIGEPTRLLLKTDQAPGDAVVMTAAIYSLHKVYPGRYTTAVDSRWPEVFECNPDVVPVAGGESEVAMHYPAIHQSNQRGIHFMQGWCEFLGMALGISLPLMTNRPRLYGCESVSNKPYWVVCSGVKKDFTNKAWGHDNYEEVVNILRGEVKFVQVGENREDHPILNGVDDIYDLVGMTTLRSLFTIVQGARGVLCGVSLLMHVAAALEKPAVVVAGGREPVSWNAYPKQHYLHTVGNLPCRDTNGQVGGACWRSRTVPLGDGTILDENTCEYPVDGLPKCMRSITPENVALTILQVESLL